MNRSDALSLLQSKVSNQNLIKHSLAVEAIMRGLARHFGEDEELWGLTSRSYSIHNEKWPQWDPQLAKEAEITLVVQVNGKVRDRLTVPVSISEEEAKELALSSESVKRHLDNLQIKSVIYVPGRLVNVVAQ